MYFLKFPRFGELLKLSKFKPVRFLACNERTYRTVVFSRSHFCQRDSSFLYCNKFSRLLFTSDVNLNHDELEENSDDEEYDEEEEEEEEKQYESLIRRTFRTLESGHTVFVIQPFIKWGPNKRTLTTPDFQLEESVALIESLPSWNVALKEKVSLTSFKQLKLFGKGKMEELKEKINKNNLISAVFVSINMLNRLQREFLESEFNVPVFDRYNIVIQIFHAHAVTKEAKLQVAMAEIPFMWYNIKATDDRGGGNVGSIGGSGETLLEIRKRLITVREQKIKKQLKKLQVHRNIIRTHRKKLELPVVAVVGYTNAGKTSLIKALTEEVKLEPRNQLFATLDVTAHEGLLPSNIKVLYMDTIGFISDIPTILIEPFKVTLEDAIQADAIVHVQDVSNPDVRSQSNHVIETLKSLNVDENILKDIITVANKVDKINIDESNDLIKDMLPVSSVKKTGIYSLRNKIERILLKNTGRISMRIRVGNGSKEYYWLFKESSVFNIETDPNDCQFAFMDVVISQMNLSKFKNKFIYSKQGD